MGRRTSPAPDVAMIRVQEHLSVLVAGERRDDVAALVTGLGHRVIGATVGVEDPARHPDVAIVAPDDGSEHALALIDRVVDESGCPVVTVLEHLDRVLLREAAGHGVFGCTVDPGPDELQATIDVVLLRYADYQNLERALARRALIERAKGILMERHSIDEDAAFEMLRAHARTTNRKVVVVAGAVVEGHRLLPG
jgi:AmiR/NasT family two-component response regulator